MEKLNLYLVTRIDTVGYDQYDSFIICCKDEEIARKTHPSEFTHTVYDNTIHDWLVKGKPIGKYSGWVEGSKIKTLKIKFIGISNQTNEEIILKSFNAG